MSGNIIEFYSNGVCPVPVILEKARAMSVFIPFVFFLWALNRRRIYLANNKTRGRGDKIIGERNLRTRDDSEL